MKFRSRFRKLFSSIIYACLISVLLVGAGGAPAAFAQDEEPPAVEADSPYATTRTIVTESGESIEEMIISGPPKPPRGYEEERQAVEPPPDLRGASSTLTVPAYDWVFGCSAVSGSMIAAYYDRNGFPSMYTGPTNGGVMPMDNSVWGNWSDGVDTYPNNPLTASHKGVDGRTTRGSIDDYWVQYGSSAKDPYKSGRWSQHAWGDAIGDYMKTSQSAYGNTDGSTVFYNWTSNAAPLTCSDMVSNHITKDGTYGRKLFYEARGYAVTDCYNQKTDNNGGGFTYAMYKAEIDAGHPVMINLQGHTIVGIGYNDPSTVYINDTWDYSNHSMTWGGSYSGMVMRSVSVVHFTNNPPVNLRPLDGALIAVGSNKVQMGWKAPTGQSTKNISKYEVQLASDAAYTNILVTKLLKKAPWKYSGLLPNTQYYWRVRALYKTGAVSVWTSDSAVMDFSTQLTKGPTLRAPGNNSKQVKASVALKWKRPKGCPSSTSYVLQYSTDPTFTVGVTEESGLLTASYNLTTLPVSATPGSTFYYWRVKAYDSAGTKEYSNWSAARSFRR
jgi:hypothetical protein